MKILCLVSCLVCIACITVPAFAGDLSEHFDTREVVCRHCGEGGLHPEVIQLLEELRSRLGNKEIVVTSGYRCEAHNKAVGGVKNSMHLYGLAVDVKVSGVSPSVVGQIAYSVGFSYVKTYQSWVHLDIRDEGGKC